MLGRGKSERVPTNFCSAWSAPHIPTPHIPTWSGTPKAALDVSNRRQGTPPAEGSSCKRTANARRLRCGGSCLPQHGHGRVVTAAWIHPRSGDGVAARAEFAPVISGRALLAAPDGEGVALQLVHVVQRVALVVVVARLDVLAWRGFLELPFASDDLDALDPLPVLLEIDVLDEEERAVQPLVGDLAFLGA